jgi:hypothetical protein
MFRGTGDAASLPPSPSTPIAAASAAPLAALSSLDAAPAGHLASLLTSAGAGAGAGVTRMGLRGRAAGAKQAATPVKGVRVTFTEAAEGGGAVAGGSPLRVVPSPNRLVLPAAAAGAVSDTAPSAPRLQAAAASRSMRSLDPNGRTATVEAGGAPKPRRFTYSGFVAMAAQEGAAAGAGGQSAASSPRATDASPVMRPPPAKPVAWGDGAGAGLPAEGPSAAQGEGRTGASPKRGQLIVTGPRRTAMSPLGR